MSRTTNDVEALSWVVRFGIPSLFVAVVTLLIYGTAALLTGWQVALAMLAGVPMMWASTRRYLRYAPDGYLRERATYAVLNGVVTENVEGARTVDALRLGARRRARVDEAITSSMAAETYTLGLRVRWFPSVEFAYIAPIAVTLVWGGWLVSAGQTSIGVVTAVALYVQQLADPLDELLSWLDEIQVGRPRSPGSSASPRCPRTGWPPTRCRTVRTCSSPARYAYRAGRDVLRGVDLDLRPGERLAIVGPSGAGKSTLGRLLAGIDGPSAGRVSVGGVRLVDLDLDRLRGEVALVTQEHHVFVGTLAENLRLAKPDASDAELLEVMAAVDAHDWVAALPGGLGTVVGSGATCSARASPSSWRWPAWCCATRTPRPRRGDLAAGPAGRSAPRALAGRSGLGPHRRRDRPPAAHGARRGPGRRGRGRADHRDRLPTTSWSPPTARMPRSGARGGTSRRTSVPPRADAPAPARSGGAQGPAPPRSGAGTATVVRVCHGNIGGRPEQPWQVGSAQGGRGQRARVRRGRDPTPWPQG